MTSKSSLKAWALSIGPSQQGRSSTVSSFQCHNQPHEGCQRFCHHAGLCSFGAQKAFVHLSEQKVISSNWDPAVTPLPDLCSSLAWACISLDPTSLPSVALVWPSCSHPVGHSAQRCCIFCCLAGFHYGPMQSWQPVETQPSSERPLWEWTVHHCFEAWARRWPQQSRAIAHPLARAEFRRATRHR